MQSFIQKYAANVTGVLQGFDRLVFRGTVRSLAVASGMMDFLWRRRVLLKDFGDFVEATTRRLKEASLRAAGELKRPVRYLPSSQTSKEDVARSIARADGIDQGLICVLSSVEPCMTYEIHRDRQQQKLVLQPCRRKCLHLYHYWNDPQLGFMHGRIQTWFPFTVQVCLNGREWLARQMDCQGLAYQRSENCFRHLADPQRAQELMDQQVRTNWPETLTRIARQLNPDHDALLAPYRGEYYWSTHQSEWASDVLFNSPAALARIYPPLVRGAMTAFSSEQVMRFLGKKITGTFQGEVTSDYRRRVEGVRLKHMVKANSIKVYDKQGSVLRVETTLNDPYDFKTYRPKEGQSEGPCDWRRMRKGVADLGRRTEVSQAANERYFDALAALDTDRRLGEWVDTICRPRRWKGHRARAMQPWAAADRALLQAINRGEFAINGLRNQDLVNLLYPDSPKNPTEQRRTASRVTRHLRLLRAHGLAKKVPHTHRYVVTKKGRHLITALLLTQDLTLKQLNQAVA